MPNLQLEIGSSKSWKQCKFVFHQENLNEPQPCDKFNCFRIMTVNNTISRYCDKFKDTLSKNIETTWVSLYNGWQEEIFFKKLCLVLKKGTFPILLVEYLELPTRINLKTAELHFCRIYKNKIVFCTNNSAEETPNLILHKISLLK